MSYMQGNMELMEMSMRIGSQVIGGLLSYQYALLFWSLELSEGHVQRLVVRYTDDQITSISLSSISLSLSRYLSLYIYIYLSLSPLLSLSIVGVVPCDLLCTNYNYYSVLYDYYFAGCGASGCV